MEQQPEKPAVIRRPRLRRLILGGLALAVVLAIALVLCIKTGTGRGWFLSLLADRIERESGIRVRIGSSDLSVLEGRVQLQDVELQAADRERPFVLAGEVDVTLRWTALLARPIRLLRVAAHDVEADTSMLPRPRNPTEENAGPLPLRVDEVVWESGSVGPWAGGDRFSVWFAHAAVHGIGGRGRLENGVLRVAESSGVLRLEHPDRPAIEADVDLTGRIELGGTIREAQVTIVGEGLQGEATVAGTRPNRFELEGLLDARLGTLFPDLALAGDAHLEGSMEWAGDRLTGEGNLRLTQLPAPLLEPWMRGALSQVRLDEKHLDAQGTYRIDVPLRRDGATEAREVVELDFETRLMRGSETLVQANVKASSDGDDTYPIRVRWQASLMPQDEEDRCVSSGTLRLPGWNRTDGSRLDDTVVEADFADLGAAAERFGLLEGGVEALHPVGGVALEARFDGPLAGLRLDGKGRWSRDGAPILEVSATSEDLAEGVFLEGSVLGDEPGRREWSTQIRPHADAGWARARWVDGRASIHLPDPYGAGEQFGAIHAALYPAEPSPPWVDLLLSADPKLGGALDLGLTVEGALARPAVEAVLKWQPGENETLSVEASGSFDLDALERSELQHFDAEAIHLSFRRLAALLPQDLAARVRGGRLDGSLHASGPVTRPVAELKLQSVGLDIEGVPAATRLSVELSATPELWTVHELIAEWSDPGYGVLNAVAEIEPSFPIRRMTATLHQSGLPGSGERAEADIELEDGLLRIVRGSIEVESGRLASFQGAIPLLPEFGISPIVSAEGEMSIAVENLDVGSALAPWMRGDSVPEIAGTLSAALNVDLRTINRARGNVRLDGFRFKFGEEKIDTVGPLNVEFENGRMTLRPGRLLAASSAISGTAPLDVAGSAAFDPGWRIGTPLTEMLRDVMVSVDGTVNASLLAPLLGATGTGPVELHLQGAGSLGDFSIDGALHGETARFLLSEPYATRIENFDAKIRTEGRRILLEHLTAQINGGEGRVDGVIDRDGGLDLRGDFAGVRYRLGFGVTARLDGELVLDWPLDGRRLLSGEVVVDRALMTRDINLDREILRAIFDPELQTGTSRLLETVDLDLRITTDQGLAIQNNLAELRADWSRLDVGGTLADPLMTGTVDVAPGGRLHLLGETLRIDEASLTWHTASPGDPVIHLQTTSSREDPTISQSWRSGWYTADFGPGQGGTLGFWSAATANTESSLGASLATYTQDRLYGSLAKVLNRTELSYEPLPLFGETDTEARFTLSQDLSSNLSFIASTNPREAEGQTYILDLHRFRVAPSLRAQVFTGDNDENGITLQQTLILGQGKGPAEGGDPLVRERTIDVPDVVSERKLRRALGFRKGDPFPRGAELDVEIDLDEAMRHAGYPDARIEVRKRDAGKNQVDLSVEIDPGPLVGFEFAGPDELPRSIRHRIVGVYRSAEEEPRAFGEMRVIAARALRVEGCFAAEVSVEAVDPAPGEERSVRVHTACTRRADPGAPVFFGLPLDVAEWTAAGFASRMSRLELAAGIAEADDHLRRTLDAVGYPEARIADRRLSDDGTRLEVFVEAGDRCFVDQVTLVDADKTTRDNARGLLTIRQGDPLRRDWIATSARALRADLRNRGYDQASVRPVVERRPEDPTRATVLFKFDTGRPSKVKQVKIEGLRKSDPSWVSNVADLATDTLLQREQVSEARGRLFRTGVFERIRVTTESLEDEDESVEPDAVRPTAIAFELQEAPRYQLSYGGRWASDVGLGGVVDLVNRNTLGRGHRTGVRTILNTQVRSLRFYHVIPSPLKSERSSLEFFVEAKREQIEDVRTEVVEGWAQLTFPLTRRIQTRVYGAIGNRRILSGVPPPDIPLEEQVISPRFGWQLAYNTVEQSLASQRRRGFFFGVDLSGSHAALGSDLTTLGLFTQFKVYAPFGEIDSGRYSWHQSYRAGVLTAREQPIPFVDRLRAGGEFSVRGYPTNSLGMLDVDGIALGGELMFVLNQEFHARLWDSLYGVVFFDAGNVWTSPSAFEFDLFKSAGIGARYTSPVGPLRFDLGFPLDRRSGDDSYQLYIGFGSVF